MRHSSTRQLYEYWSRIRGNRIAPERRDVEPAEIGCILSDTFILEATDEGVFPYRLAGTHICSLHGRELKGADWLAEWPPSDRTTLAPIMKSMIAQASGAVLIFRAHNDRGQAVTLESMLLPLSHCSSGYRRILGATAPLDKPYWLGARPVIELSLGLVDQIPPRDEAVPDAPRPTLAAEGRSLRRVGHLRLYDGGRPD